MLLAIDIGNTNIVLGLFREGELIGDVRIKTSPELSAFACESLLRAQFAGAGFSCDEIRGVAMASVVPRLDVVFAQACKALFGREPLIAGAHTPAGLEMRYETPGSLGADRIVNAVAAYERFGTAAIAVDMGTATTFDYVDAGGAYLGGAISPGIATAADALFHRAAKLPRVDLAFHGRLIGRSTVECMQAGIVAGYACMVDGLIERMKAEAGGDAAVVATGGLARLVARHARRIDAVDDHLLLRGLKVIYERCTT